MAEEKKASPKSLAVRSVGRQLPVRRYEDLFGWPFSPALWRGFPAEEAFWAPAIHVQEKDDKFVAKIELPGVDEDDINIEVQGDMLVVEGEKRAESEVKKKGYYYSETSYGSFSRSIPIPTNVDADRVTANFDKGVLEVDLPKAVEIKPKKINVTAKKKEVKVTKEETDTTKK